MIDHAFHNNALLHTICDIPECLGIVARNILVVQFVHNSLMAVLHGLLPYCGTKARAATDIACLPDIVGHYGRILAEMSLDGIVDMADDKRESVP